jgi:ATPase subunit of ABC transporter with duplicated ATPase domains
LNPSTLRRTLCPQTVDSLSGEVRAFAASSEGEARRLFGELRLDPSGLERWGSLSPGERKRWQIGAALAAAPGLLLLDEPTNHLDPEARDLLLAALHRFRGVGVVVSHDRLFLEDLTTHTVRFHQGHVGLWTGAYSAARRSWEAVERGELDAYDKLSREKRKLRRRLADRRRQREAAVAAATTRRQMKGPRDSDARFRLKATKRRSAEASLGREIRTVRRKIERAGREQASFRIRKSPGRSLFVDYVRAPVPVLLEVDAPEIRVGERRLLGRVQLSIDRDSRIRVAGPNGIGKSTLLARLLDGARVPHSRLLHLPQELGPDQEIGLLESVRRLSPKERGSVLAFVAALGVDPDALLGSERPSPGEARKLWLSYGLGRQVWALVLDEPTNHLDLPSIERLEEALSAYPGALVLVTHDDELARRCISTRWEISGGSVLTRTEATAEPEERREDD